MNIKSNCVEYIVLLPSHLSLNPTKIRLFMLLGECRLLLLN